MQADTVKSRVSEIEWCKDNRFNRLLHLFYNSYLYQTVLIQLT